MNTDFNNQVGSNGYNNQQNYSDYNNNNCNLNGGMKSSKNKNENTKKFLIIGGAVLVFLFIVLPLFKSCTRSVSSNLSKSKIDVKINDIKTGIIRDGNTCAILNISITNRTSSDISLSGYEYNVYDSNKNQLYHSWLSTNLAKLAASNYKPVGTDLKAKSTVTGDLYVETSSTDISSVDIKEIEWF